VSYYARETTVSPERTQGEIVEVLKRYQAKDYMTGWVQGKALVAFKLKELGIRYLCPMPDPQHRAFTHSSKGVRTQQQAVKAWEQAVKQRWRALLLIIKAKLEAIAAGISSVEEEFLANVVTQRGTTIGQELLPQLPEIRKGGGVQLLPALPAPKVEA
jgi:hypothetical protein